MASIVLYDENGNPITGIVPQGTHGWDSPDVLSEEYRFCETEGWMLRRDFERKYKIDYALE